MDYELAKQLKDAGFPQNTIWCFRVDNGTYDKRIIRSFTDETIAENRLACSPILDELIEACGEEFIQLELAKSKLGEWCAQGGWEEQHIDIGHCRTPRYDVFGSSPTEAIARLWLALNNHENAA